MTIKIYNQEKKLALRFAALKLDKLTTKEKMSLAIKIGVSMATVDSYYYGNGNNFETALKIIEG